jgi:hypothetical protein
MGFPADGARGGTGQHAHTVGTMIGILGPTVSQAFASGWSFIGDGLHTCRLGLQSISNKAHAALSKAFDALRNATIDRAASDEQTGITLLSVRLLDDDAPSTDVRAPSARYSYDPRGLAPLVITTATEMQERVDAYTLDSADQPGSAYSVALQRQDLAESTKPRAQATVSENSPDQWRTGGPDSGAPRGKWTFDDSELNDELLEGDLPLFGPFRLPHLNAEEQRQADEVYQIYRFSCEGTPFAPLDTDSAAAQACPDDEPDARDVHTDGALAGDIQTLTPEQLADLERRFLVLQGRLPCTADDRADPDPTTTALLPPADAATMPLTRFL